jgi:hypothetical protein
VIGVGFVVCVLVAAVVASDVSVVVVVVASCVEVEAVVLVAALGVVKALVMEPPDGVVLGGLSHSG